MTQPGRWSILWHLGLVGCAAPLDAPPAFESERFLCGAEHVAEFDAMLEECRDMRLANPASCSGVVSFQGVIDSQPVVLDAFADRATYTDVPNMGRVERLLMVTAPAPYFEFQVGPTLALDPETGELRDLGTLGSAGVESTVNVEGRGGNYLTTFADPEFRISHQAPGEFRVEVAGVLRRGGNLDLCMHVFPVPVSVNR